ncbi:conserved hypothetical protein [Ricinus communis]|uniref:Uncharacterized protein n=1 Tax=Ricinus communis TaxID=3988 RepID=B9S9Q6_RICCO|nr:conserved hypothetical protein [Ricinus communis]
MACSSFLCLSLCLLIFFHSSLAQIEQAASPYSEKRSPQRGQQYQCQLSRINAAEPSRRFQSEAGLTEIWDENDQQFQCVGVVAMRLLFKREAYCCHNTSMDLSSFMLSKAC